MIYHITTKAEWLLSKTEGIYKPESLQTEGFIHCSTRVQVEQIANFYFKGAKDLILLEIDEEKLNVEVKWEGEGSQKFPHIYGPLPVHCVVRDVAWVESENGLFEFPLTQVLH